MYYIRNMRIKYNIYVKHKYVIKNQLSNAKAVAIELAIIEWFKNYIGDVRDSVL